jgi:hypothetical protein
MKVFSLLWQSRDNKDPSGPSTLLGQHKVFLFQIDFTYGTFDGLIRRGNRDGCLLDLPLTDMIELSPCVLVIHDI